MSPTKVLIMGAAGRDFHNFNVVYRGNPRCRVVAFTAYQIPNIAGRTYPPALAGKGYPRGIPIYPESELPRLIRDLKVQEVVFSYSDVSHEEVMHRASLALAAGADFKLLGPGSTMLRSRRPVVSVGAVRTGCGKSQTSRLLARLLHARGLKVAVVRHPMPYGKDLNAQRLQRFETRADLDRHECTIEEREEYEAHLQAGRVVFAGVDYAAILAAAEKEADVVLWDGGNNDFPFFRTGLHVVVADPHRPGHELSWHPGEANVRLADVIVINKVNTAPKKAVEAVAANVRALNPRAKILRAASVVTVEDAPSVRGRRVLVVEDGPTLTHGGMAYGAGTVAARACGARIVDPRPWAAGSLKKVFRDFPHLKDVLPAMGYGARQVAELKRTIEAAPCDLVLVGTPFDLGRLLKSRKPMRRVSYELDEGTARALDRELGRFLKRAGL